MTSAWPVSEMMRAVLFFMMATSFAALASVYGARSKKPDAGASARNARTASILFLIAAGLFMVAGIGVLIRGN